MRLLLKLSRFLLWLFGWIFVLFLAGVIWRDPDWSQPWFEEWKDAVREHWNSLKEL